MSQTAALLVDAYRELNARKMFWISLILSGVIIGAFALLGVNDNELSLLGMNMPVPAARFWYKYIFSVVVIGIWISWGAVILALISTAGIFPDLIAGGSIDLYLSKPISRVRLFLTKYLGGLLFVLLQSAVFAVGCYLVFGWRSGQWRSSIFLIIPLTTLLFSYVFAICVLVGVLTRSTMAALLVTVLLWLLFSLATRTEQFIFQMRATQNSEVRTYERQARQAESELEDLKRNLSLLNTLASRERRATQRRDTALRNAERSRESAAKWTTAHRIAMVVAAVLPKTSETIGILDRRIFDDADLAEFRKQMMGDTEAFEEEFEREPATQSSTTTSPTTNPVMEHDTEWKQRREAQIEAQEAATRAERARSVSWALSTSLAFEAVILAFAAWIFCRRDY